MLHVTLRQLSIFEAVARRLSFTRAAEELHLTQPAISLQIKQLERAVSLPLFEQVGKRVYLTDAGRELYFYARRMQQDLAEAEGVMEGLRGVQRGRLNIAVASTANYFAPRLLAAFAECYPHVKFTLDVTNRQGLLHHLEANDNDMVIMGRPPDAMDLDSVPFMDNPLVVVAAAKHPLVGQRRIPLERIRRESFVLREEGSGTRIAMERFFAKKSIVLSTGMEMSSNEGIKQSVEAGLGLGIVSLHTLELVLNAGRIKILDVEGFPIMRHWYLVHRKGKRPSPVAQAFKDFVHAEAANLMQLPVNNAGNSTLALGA